MLVRLALLQHTQVCTQLIKERFMNKCLRAILTTVMFLGICSSVFASEKNLYINDIVHRLPGYTFTESTNGSLLTVTLKNASSVVVDKSTKLVLIDAYRALRANILLREEPVFLSTTTQRNALTSVDKAIQLYNITIGRDEVYDGTNWIGVDEIVFHAEIHDEDNTTEFVINGQDEHHAYHSAGVTSGDLEGWTFNEGSNGTPIAISSIADAGSGDITVTSSTAHGIVVGDIVSQTGLSDSNYVGFFTIKTVPTTTTYTITATWGATGTGFMDEPSYIQADAIGAGHYMITWTASLSSASGTVTLDFFLHDGTATITGSKGRHRIANASTFKMIGGQAVRNVLNGDRIFFAISNTTNSTNITIRDFSLIAVKL